MEVTALEAVEAGRIAYETGLSAAQETASPTSPLTSFLGAIA